MTARPVFDPPVSADHTRPFWDAVEREALALPRCSICGRWQWYPEPSGTDCPGGELVWHDVALTGTISTYTRVHRSFLPGGRSQTDPYAVGLIRLDDVEGPTLVASLDDDAALAVGARVRARFEQAGDRLHPVFRIIEREEHSDG